jgi:hypothetical protein
MGDFSFLIFHFPFVILFVGDSSVVGCQLFGVITFSDAIIPWRELFCRSAGVPPAFVGPRLPAEFDDP